MPDFEAALSEEQLLHTWCFRARKLSPRCKLGQSVWKDEGVLCGVDTETDTQAFQQVLHQQDRTASGHTVRKPYLSCSVRVI